MFNALFWHLFRRDTCTCSKNELFLKTKVISPLAYKEKVDPSMSYIFLKSLLIA